VTALVVLLRRPLASPDGEPAARLIGRCDDAALRAGLALRAARPRARLTAIAVGPPEREDELLRHALARGADRALRVWDPGLDGVDYHGTAQVLAAATRAAGADLVLCGERSDDEGDGAVGPAVAEVLGVPHLTAVLDVALDGGVALATRRDQGRLRTFRLRLPALITMVRSPAAAAPLAWQATEVEALDLQALGIHASGLRPRLHCMGPATPVVAPDPTLAGGPDDLIARLRQDRLLEP
jgi:electron transfer flavoprotein beta subunit